MLCWTDCFMSRCFVSLTTFTDAETSQKHEKHWRKIQPQLIEYSLTATHRIYVNWKQTFTFQILGNPKLCSYY